MLGIEIVYKDTNSKENASSKISYYEWLIDRGVHGLSNTIGQYIGDWKTFRERWGKAFKLYDWRTQPHELLKYLEEGIKDLKGIDQILTKNWSYWDLIKFIYGYKSFTGAVYGGEAELYSFGLPLAYKAFGIPRSAISGEPYIMGTMGGEWAVCIPDNIAKTLKQSFPNRIVIGYGNLISMYSAIDGLEKDGIEKIGQWLTRGGIYLWKKRS